MKITDKSEEFLVEFEPRVIDYYGDKYEVRSIVVTRFYDDTGEAFYSSSMKGYKLTKAGDRSKAAPHPLPIFDHDIEAEAIDVVQTLQGAEPNRKTKRGPSHEDLAAMGWPQ